MLWSDHGKFVCFRSSDLDIVALIDNKCSSFELTDSYRKHGYYCMISNR